VPVSLALISFAAYADFFPYTDYGYGCIERKRDWFYFMWPPKAGVAYSVSF